jgi:hypothetical protein
MKKTVFALLLLLCVGINPVFACLIPTENPAMTATPVPSLEDYSQRASVIFLGTVSGWTDLLNSGSFRYQIQVKRYFKGAGNQIVMLENYYSFCMDRLEIGQEFIFFAEGDGGGAFVPRYQYLTLVQSSEESVVLGITSTTNFPQLVPPDMELTPIADKSDMTWLYNSFNILGLFSSVIGFGLWWRGRRKSKSKRGEML